MLLCLYFLHGSCVFFLCSQSNRFLSLLKSQRFRLLILTAAVDAKLTVNCSNTLIYFRKTDERNPDERLHWVSEASGTEVSPDVTSWLRLSILLLRGTKVWHFKILDSVVLSHDRRWAMFSSVKITCLCIFIHPPDPLPVNGLWWYKDVTLILLSINVWFQYFHFGLLLAH